MGERVVKNYPSPRLMDVIGATNQKPPEAIGELVANSFDARYEDEKMNIIVDLRDGQIVILDNGKGMTSPVLEKAVCIAEDMSAHIERGEGTKGHFGMGFKTSCSTLGWFYEIYTRPVEEDIEYHVAFDISDYSTRPAGADAWDVVIEDSAPRTSSPLGYREHGTAFVIKRLKDRNITVSAVLSYLGEAFKAHIERGDKITIIDGENFYEAVPKEYSFIPGSKIEIDETFGPNGKYHVTGWMALDKQTHNDGLYGFNIYRNDQLVEKWDKSWFRAHLMTSRIIGEVEMDFLDATFFKQGIQQSEDWTIVSAHMKEYLKPLVTASNNISKKGNINRPNEVKRIMKQLSDDYGDDSIIDDPDNDQPIEDTPADNRPQTSVNEQIKNVINEGSLELDGVGEITITNIEKEQSNVRAPFDYIFFGGDEDEEEHIELQVIIFKDHPLWEKKADRDVVIILATADAIYRMLVEKLGFETSEALRISNEWIMKRTTGTGET